MRTNIVFFRLDPATAIAPDAMVGALRERGVLVSSHGDELRAVTHRWVDGDDADALVAAVRDSL